MFPSGINCYKPANGETVCMTTIATITVDMSLDLLKRKVTSLESKGQFFMLWSNQSHGTRAVKLDEKLRPTAGTFSQIKAESRFVLEALVFLYHPAWRILYHTTSLSQALSSIQLATKLQEEATIPPVYTLYQDSVVVLGAEICVLASHCVVWQGCVLRTYLWFSVHKKHFDLGVEWRTTVCPALKMSLLSSSVLQINIAWL